MRLYEALQSKNDCMSKGRRLAAGKPSGIVVHSTGANNPRLSRYCDGPVEVIGTPSSLHWNQPGLAKCVHAFVGKDKDGRVATVQTLPWDWRGWHVGSGSKGSYNNTHVGFEICEDGLTDPEYFKAVWAEAVDLCAYLCRTYGIEVRNIRGHFEACKDGYGSNHGDPNNWFPQHGKTMDDFRAEVQRTLDGPWTEEIEMYNSIGECPAWAQASIKDMIDRGFISGNGTGRKDENGYPADLALPYDSMRLLVILDKVIRSFEIERRY